CVFFSKQAVNHLLETNERFRENYIGFLSSRIRFLNRKIAYLTAGSAERRLALYLLSLGAGEVELKESIAALSDLLNLGRASLYRAFDKLCEDGYLLKNGRRLTILNSEAMLNAYK
ncbi:MAG: Crp/Fnr family transcriptional regulator, partial [Clostridia bacterium]|nr:Crp/Fnr family transcriptional regulator [Clostridia bacterium]